MKRETVIWLVVMLLGAAGLGLVVALVQLLADASMRGPPLIVMTIPLTIAGFAIGITLAWLTVRFFDLGL